LSAKYWKLAITSLSPGSTSAREAVVEGENWLSALRAARKVLGEDGAVPPGASCVMSSTGEVTILDSAHRLRYQLSRSEAPVGPSPVQSAAGTEQTAIAATERPPASLPPPAIKAVPGKRTATLAYSPEEAAVVRGQLTAATASASANPTQAEPAKAGTAAAPSVDAAPAAPAAANATKPEPKPAFSPARPRSTPPGAKGDSNAPKADPRNPIPPKRNATVAYSPKESVQIRRFVEQAKLVNAAATKAEPAETRPQAAAAASTTAATPAPAPAQPESSPTPVQAPANPRPAAGGASSSPAPTASAATRPARRQTIAYSPEESARARSQLQAAQAIQTASTTTNIASSTQDHLVQSEVPSMLVMLGHRDEETSQESPLTYRERSYYWPPPAGRNEVERALRAELSGLQKALVGRARGQYVNLAVFDHAFSDKPMRPPVATLQWKDWRGEAVFAWLEPSAPSWQVPPAGKPVTSSFLPDPLAPAPSAFPLPTAPLPAPSPPPAAAAAPFPLPAPAAAPLPQPAPAPSPQPALAAAPLAEPAPLAAAAPAQSITTPMRAPTRRESTGEQDLRLTVAFEAVQDLYFLATPADGLDFAVKLLAELVPSEAISGCIYDINTDEFRFVALTGEGASDRRAAAVRSKQGLFGAAAHGGRDNLIVPDVMSDARFDPEIDGRQNLAIRNMAFFVLHKADQLFGMLQLINRDSGRAFSEADVAVASYIADQMTTFLREKRGLTRARG
jgi:hypothetical protein